MVRAAVPARSVFHIALSSTFQKSRPSTSTAFAVILITCSTQPHPPQNGAAPIDEKLHRLSLAVVGQVEKPEAALIDEPDRRVALAREAPRHLHGRQHVRRHRGDMPELGLLDFLEPQSAIERCDHPPPVVGAALDHGLMAPPEWPADRGDPELAQLPLDALPPPTRPAWPGRDSLPLDRGPGRQSDLAGDQHVAPALAHDLDLRAHL